MAEEYDAVVIGCGPAGSEFCRFAAKAGMNVLMVDKKKELGSPVRCGEGITTHWEKELGIDLNPKCVAQHILGVDVFAPSGHKVRIKTPSSTGVVLERKIFDKQLAMAAGRAGAHILPHTLVTGLVREGGKAVGVKAVHYGEEREFRAPLIVSAEGMEAKIARELGFRALSNLYDVDTCVEYEMVNVDCSEQMIEVYFGNKIAPRGYVWVFPKGKDVANVGIGIGGSTGGDPKKLLDEFIKNDPKRYGRAEIIEVKGGIISVAEPQKQLVMDGAMVIGTAGHMVDPIHGGGIGLAIEAGALAGKVAAKAWEKGDFSASNLKEYETAWWGKSGQKMLKRFKLRKVMEQLGDDDFNALLGAISENDLDAILKGNYAGVLTKVMPKMAGVFLRRPRLLGLLKTLA